MSDSKIKRKAQVILFCTSPKQKLLLLQTNKLREFIWQNITGSVEDGEDFSEGAYRELLEETGVEKSELIDFKDLEIDMEFTDRWKKNCHEKVYIAVISNEKEIVLDADEHDNYKWIELADVDQSCYSYSSNYQAYLKAFEYLNE
jgi:8-oxo-dGTP pyrophosphatase MutT (NUDIX family)